METVSSVSKLNLKEREEKIREILKEKGSDENEIVTSEDVRRRWAAYLEKLCPACPWLALVPNNKVVVILFVLLNLKIQTNKLTSLR